MGKKLTYEFVKASFEKEGYTLLSKEYTNSQTMLNYKCPNNHLHLVSWNNWQADSRCSQCSKKIKRTIEEVRASFLKEFNKMGWSATSVAITPEASGS